MSDTRPLPDNPSLDWLRKQAKRHLDTIRQSNASARLSDAQLDLARQYGFPSWRALKAQVDALTIGPLLSSILEQADQSPPPVKAAALLSVARVLNERSHDEAIRALERGIAIAQTLREPTRHVLLGEAFTLAAWVSPEHAFSLLPDAGEDGMRNIYIASALQRMLERGHADAVVRYLLGSSDQGFPYDAARSALYRAADDRVRTLLLRRAIRAARHSIDASRPDLPHDLSELLQLLNDRWQALPADEAAALVRELVAVIVAAADQKGRISWNDVRFSSTRQHLLFCLFNSCRHLEPELAASLVAEYPQLAKAVTRYPNGMARDWEDADGRVPGAPPTHARTPDLAELAQMDYLTLDNASLPVAEELRSNFDRAFTVALSAYAIDSDQRRPNTAPRQCWPSAMSFRSILYKAGIYEGRRAERHLARVPDAALRLFAQIELAAALAGVDQFGGTAMRQAPEWPRPQPERDDTIDPADWMPPMPPPFAGKPDVSPSYEARISVSQQPDGGLPTGGCDEDFWVIEGARLRPVLASLFDMSALRIVVPPALEHERFDFTLVLPRPETREVLLASMQVGVERNFDITRERRPVEAWVLTAPRGIQAHRTYGDLGSELGAGGGIAGGSWEMVGPTVSFSHQASDFEDTFVSSLMDLSAVPAREEAFEQGMQAQKDRFLRMPHGPGAIVGLHQSLTMRELCLVLESTLGRVFVDESGTSASYWINVETDPMDPDRFLEMLNKELGVEIAPAEREVEMLVVRRA